MTTKELKAKYPDLVDMFKSVKDGRHIHIQRKYIANMWLGTTYPPTTSEADFYTYVNRAIRDGATALKIRIMPSAEKKGPCVEECEVKLEEATNLGNPETTATTTEQAVEAMKKVVEDKLASLTEPGANQLQLLQNQLTELRHQAALDKQQAEFDKKLALLNKELEEVEKEKDELIETIAVGSKQLAGLEEKNKSFAEKWSNIIGSAFGTGLERAVQKNPWVLEGIGIPKEVIQENLFPEAEKKAVEGEKTETASEPAAPQPAAPKPAGAKDEFAGLDPDHKKNLLLLIAACKVMTLDEFKLFLKVTLSMFDKEGLFSPEAAVDIYQVLDNEMKARTAAEEAKAAETTTATT
jgi:hypothetical protein